MYWSITAVLLLCNALSISECMLAETKVEIYRKVGGWLADNTPPNATVGFTELGVMSYYAQRHAVDFLGLTHPQYRDSIRHGDFLRGLLSEQPDYVALTNINSIYTHNPQQEAWFQRLYRPIATFEDARFWGSPMTVWQRHAVPLLATHLADNVPHDLGGGWQVTAVRSSSQSIAAGQPQRIGCAAFGSDSQAPAQRRLLVIDGYWCA